MVCGLKKDEHHHTSILVNSNLEEINISKTSDLFHYLARMQDEVHRYTITYHRLLRNKGSIASELDNIKGIGSKRKKKLIIKFGSVKALKNASINELKEIVPENVAYNLKKYLNDKYE